jgi:exopolysaccharide biosynthesis protein
MKIILMLQFSSRNVKIKHYHPNKPAFSCVILIKRSKLLYLQLLIIYIWEAITYDLHVSSFLSRLRILHIVYIRSMRLIAILTLLTLNISFSSAQTDSVYFRRAEWTTKRIAPGIHLKQVWFRGKTLFNSNQFISILEVKERRNNTFSLAYEPKQKRTTSDFGSEQHAIAAINGTFFDVKNGGSVDYIKANGQIINENRLDKENKRARHQQAALVMRDGKLHIDEWDGSADWEKKLDGEDVMLTGPLLLHNNKQVALDSASFNVLRHPRSAVAITENNRVLLITIDGRSVNSAGVSLFELRKILRWLHCRDGINLDGGGSTTLWENKDGVVNYPSDGGKWDHKTQRKVANVILVNRN